MATARSLARPGALSAEDVSRAEERVLVGRDPVLAHAAQELGVTISPEDAGKLFPYEWPKE